MIVVNFYPTKKASFDAESFDNYIKSGGKYELSDFRRNNVNLLIKDIYQTVKSENKDLLFGVSPSGNIQRNYDELYADTALWCSKKGYIDYICPQIYFGFEHSTHPFEKVCKDFSEMCANGGVDLIIGITLEKAALATEKKEDIYAGNGSDEWINNKNLIARMLGCIRTIDNCGGIASANTNSFISFDKIEGSENMVGLQASRGAIVSYKTNTASTLWGNNADSGGLILTGRNSTNLSGATLDL